MNRPSDRDLDELYDLIDNLMKDGDWWLLDNMCCCWSEGVNLTDLDDLLGRATATLPGKSKLPSRAAFIAKCKKVHPDPELWKGLE